METNTRQTIILDTTVITLWFHRSHPLRLAALQVRGDYVAGKIDVMVPDFALYELELSLRRCQSYSSFQAEQASSTLSQMGLKILPTVVPCIKKSIEIANQLGASLSAAYFLAVAEYYSCRYMTADREFYSRALDHPLVLPLGYDAKRTML